MRPRRDEDDADRFTAYLRGEAKLRLEALAFAIWVKEGRSRASKPSKNEALRQLLMGTVSAADLVVKRFKCTNCGGTYGAPWCPKHEDRFFPVVTA